MRQGHQNTRGRSSRAYWLLGAVAVVVVATGVWAFVSESGPPAPSTSAAIVVPETTRVALRETRPTLDPGRFVGKAAVTHQIARDIPEVLDQLYCYCECDKSIGHKSLLSCYTDGHAAT
jgi:hypothetical protein